jgi:hypothetical protein
MAKAPKGTLKEVKRSAPDLLFSRVWVGRRDLAWVLAQDDPPKGNRSRFLRYKAGAWGHRYFGWGGVALSATLTPSMDLIVVGADGPVLHGMPAGFSDEQIDPSASGPEFNGQIRDARFIGPKVVAVGMSRQVYRREQKGQWAHIDQGVLAKPRDMVGFNSVDGFAPNDIYAVGLKGEIWHYDGKNWRQEESPTNVALHRVRCVSGKKGAVYACGAGGMLLRGSPDGFQVIAQGSATDNFYGLEWFEGKLYVAGLTALYVLEDDALQPVDVGLGEGVTFGDLHANDGVMWSVGARHILTTEDGGKWTQLFYSE